MRKNVLDYIRKGLRRLWGRSLQRNTAMKKAKVEYGKYLCGSCGKIFRRKDIQVDHIIPVGRFVDWETYIERLFVDPKGLMILCLDCHKKKTKNDMKKIRR